MKVDVKAIVKKHADLSEAHTHMDSNGKPTSHTIEAYGVKGMKSTPWRKTFKHAEHLDQWCEKHSADCHGVRELDKMQVHNAEEVQPIVEESHVTKVRKALESQGVHPDSVGKNKHGHVVVRKGFFYRSGMDSHKYKEKVSNALTAAGVKHDVVDHGEHYTSFRGGASVANQSHWHVHVKLHESLQEEGAYSNAANHWLKTLKLVHGKNVTTTLEKSSHGDSPHHYAFKEGKKAKVVGYFNTKYDHDHVLGHDGELHSHIVTESLDESRLAYPEDLEKHIASINSLHKRVVGTQLDFAHKEARQHLGNAEHHLRQAALSMQQAWGAHLAKK